MNINFVRIDDRWIMQISTDTDTLPAIDFDNNLTTEEVTDLAIKLAKGDILKVNINFTGV